MRREFARSLDRTPHPAQTIHQPTWPGALPFYRESQRYRICSFLDARMVLDHLGLRDLLLEIWAIVYRLLKNSDLAPSLAATRTRHVERKMASGMKALAVGGTERKGRRPTMQGSRPGQDLRESVAEMELD